MTTRQPLLPNVYHSFVVKFNPKGRQEFHTRLGPLAQVSVWKWFQNSYFLPGQTHSFLHLKDFFFCQKWKYEVIAINFLINFFHAPKFTVLPFSEYLFWQWKKFQGVNWKRHSEINACRMIQSLEEGNGGELIR